MAEQYRESLNRSVSTGGVKVSSAAEQYREEEERSRDMAAAAAQARKLRDELAAKKAASDAAIASTREQAREREARTTVSTSGREAAEQLAENRRLAEEQARVRDAYVKEVATYQQTQTPMGERIREIRKERPAPAVAVSAVYPDTPTFREAGVAGEKVRQVAAPGAREDPGERAARAQATKELVKAGYKEEDLETPFVELGGTPETGYTPPYVLAQMEEDAGIPEEERSPVTEPYRAIVQPRRGYPWAGALMLGVIISFALRVRDG